MFEIKKTRRKIRCHRPSRCLRSEPLEVRSMLSTTWVVDSLDDGIDSELALRAATARAAERFRVSESGDRSDVRWIAG